jgi:hypothetical protein
MGPSCYRKVVIGGSSQRIKEKYKLIVPRNVVDATMAKTLSKKDPNLVEAVKRLKRIQQIWGVLLISLGGLTEWAGANEHPVAGLPLIAVGLLALVWAEPALLATVATVVVFSIVPTINPRLTILGPDPLLQVASLSVIELVALVVGKSLIVLTAAGQFFFYRFLYGTARATTDDPELAIIPAMVPNRTDGLARAARWIGLFGLVLGAAGLLFIFAAPGNFLPILLAEMAGSLGVVAIGMGLGCAFSPTDERNAALTSVLLGLVAYVLGAAVLLA